MCSSHRFGSNLDPSGVGDSSHIPGHSRGVDATIFVKRMTLESLFYLDTEKGCNSEDACRCANELVHELTESKKRSGRQSAAPS